MCPVPSPGRGASRSNTTHPFEAALAQDAEDGRKIDPARAQIVVKAGLVVLGLRRRRCVAAITRISVLEVHLGNPRKVVADHFHRIHPAQGHVRGVGSEPHIFLDR